MAFHFTIPDASIQDTLRYIINFVNQYSTDPFVQQFAKDLDPSTDKESFIRRLFDYICQHGKYQLDKDGEEEVWTPAKTIRTRNADNKFQYDCKKITILIGSVLKAAGIEPILKHVYYTDGNGGYESYTHIYIIVPESSTRSGTHTMEFAMDPYITVDPTNNCMWNTEVHHDKGTLYFLNGKQQEEKMNLHLIGKPNGQSASLMQMFGESAGQIENDMNAIACPDKSIGAHSDAGHFDYNIAEGILHNSAIPIMFVPRNAFLAIIYLGGALKNTSVKINIAYNLANAWHHTEASRSKGHKLWWLAGGTDTAIALRTAIAKSCGIPGVTTTTLGATSSDPGEYDKGYIITDVMQGHSAMNGSIGQGPETLAAVAAAAPLIKIFLDFIHSTIGQPADGPSNPPAPPADGIPIPKDTNNTPVLPGPPKAGSILDLSSPLNTIVKAAFLMSLSPMFPGWQSYTLNVFCIAAILFSSVKFFNR